MSSQDPPTQPQTRSPIQPLLGLDFRALNSRTVDPNQALDETWDLNLPGLTDEIRWTLAALKRELAIEAYRWGGSPTAFLPIPWARWKEILAVNSLNAAKTRLARLEQLGLIEVLPCERGPWGSSPNGYRLGTGEGTQTFQGVMAARERSLIRKKKTREALDEGADSARNPGHAFPGATSDRLTDGDRGRGDAEAARPGPSVPNNSPLAFPWRPRVIPGSRAVQIDRSSLT